MTDSSPRQDLFREMLLGTLIYSVVLGFFNDYTDILATTSYSITFALAFVLQILTLLTLRLKKRVAGRFRRHDGSVNRVGLVLSIWLIMFSSKFVFLAVIERLLGDTVEINGFLGIMAIIVVTVLAQLVVERIERALGP